MYIVPIIKDGKMVKRHTEYAITNGGWKLIEFSLSAYLESLDLDGYNTYRHRIITGTDRALKLDLASNYLLNNEPPLMILTTTSLDGITVACLDMVEG